MIEPGFADVTVRGCGYTLSAHRPAAAADVSTYIDGGVGRIVLDRPSALNALTTDMISVIARALDAWDGESLNAVVISSSSEKAFCAGGDIRQIRKNTIEKDYGATEEFFSTEYALNARIAHYRTPIVSVIDGICMGGGLGLAMHGHFQVVTEKASFAMPENVIGFFPDVGASYFLSRLPGALGMYIGMTGNRLTALDAIHTGLATHYVDSAVTHRIPELLAADPQRPVDETLRLLAPPSGSSDSALATNRVAIDHCFGAPSVDGIYGRLSGLNTEWAQSTLEVLDAGSPQSLAITHAMITRGRQRDIDQCLTSELDVALSLSRSEDFIEGVRAALVDKDHSPSWRTPQFSGFDADGSSSWTFLD